MTDSFTLSLIVPMYNESENVFPMIERISAALEGYEPPYEVIIVDDGSSDDTGKFLLQAAEKFGEHIQIVSLQRNFGQTAAMQAGIDHARGDIMVTLDGDLQNDPADIPRMVQRLIHEDLDLLVGWRKQRRDEPVRKFFSRVANRLIGRVTKVKLNDYGCSLKVYRGEVIRDVRLYGEMHRFIPAWMALSTSPSRIREEVVNHQERQFGTSKYGLSRTFRVLFDLLSVYFFQRFLSRPGHFFGRLGMIFGAIGGLGLFYLGIIKFILGDNIGQRPMLLISVMLVIMAIQMFTTGLLGEVLSRTYFSTGNHKPYKVRRRSSANLDQPSWKTTD